jgi:hypothetical protein
METNESIEQVLDNLDKNIVYKTKNSLMWGFLFMIPGIVSLVVYSSIEWEPTNVLAHILFVTGSILSVIGILKCFFRKSNYVSAENNKKVIPFYIYFNGSERDRLIRLLETGNLSELKALQSSIVDGMKIRVMATKDGQICYSQVVAFVQNEFVNVTAVRKHSSADYQILSALALSRK